MSSWAMWKATSALTVIASSIGAVPGWADAQSMREAPAAYAMPVSDPDNRFTPREPVATSGLERVVATVALGPSGPELVALLVPDLTSAMELEVSQAFPKCIYKPIPETQSVPPACVFHCNNSASGSSKPSGPTQRTLQTGACRHEPCSNEK